MSIWEKYLSGWTFRTNEPEFDPGEEIAVFLTDHRNGNAIARVGDTILRVDDAPTTAVDDRVRLRIDEFDSNDNTGRATFLESIDGEQT